jgi:hypothetical protein
MIRPDVVASPAAARMMAAWPRLARGQQADQRDHQRIDQRRERCGRPDLVLGAGIVAGQLLLGHREGDEQQPDEGARDAGAAVEEVMEAGGDHRLTVPGRVGAGLSRR